MIIDLKLKDSIETNPVDKVTATCMHNGYIIAGTDTECGVFVYSRQNKKLIRVSQNIEVGSSKIEAILSDGTYVYIVSDQLYAYTFENLELTYTGYSYNYPTTFMVIDENGIIYAAEVNNIRSIRFDGSGFSLIQNLYVSAWPANFYPYDMAYNGDYLFIVGNEDAFYQGNIKVVSVDNGVMASLDEIVNPLSSLYYSVGFDDDYIYVSSDDALYVYSFDGNTLTEEDRFDSFNYGSNNFYIKHMVTNGLYMFAMCVGDGLTNWVIFQYKNASGTIDYISRVVDDISRDRTYVTSYMVWDSDVLITAYKAPGYSYGGIAAWAPEEGSGVSMSLIVPLNEQSCIGVGNITDIAQNRSVLLIDFLKKDQYEDTYN